MNGIRSSFNSSSGLEISLLLIFAAPVKNPGTAFTGIDFIHLPNFINPLGRDAAVATTAGVFGNGNNSLLSFFANPVVFVKQILIGFFNLLAG
jgi:hypothetical protein